MSARTRHAGVWKLSLVACLLGVVNSQVVLAQADSQSAGKSRFRSFYETVRRTARGERIRDNRATSQPTVQPSNRVPRELLPSRLRPIDEDISPNNPIEQARFEEFVDGPNNGEQADSDGHRGAGHGPSDLRNAHNSHGEEHDLHSHGNHGHGPDGHGSDHGGHGGHSGGHGHGHLFVPPMIGTAARGPGERAVRFPVGRLVLNPTMFTLGNVPPGSPLTLTQPGPINILDSVGAISVQQLQQFHRARLMPNPAANVVGTIAETAVFNSTQTVTQINSSFAATSQPYDVIQLNAPPSTYQTAVDAVFQAQNTISGQTIYDPSASGGLRSFDTEITAPLNGPLMAGDNLDAFYAYDFVTTMAVPTPSGDGLVGRTSVGTNNSPIPTNRLYFDYSLVNNAVPINRMGSFDRFTLGFERAINVIFEGHLSVEARIPFAASLDHRIAVETGMGPSQVEMGNALIAIKHLISSSDTFAISGGLGLQLPTGSDIEIESLSGTQFLRFDNEATHLKPFLAFAYAPDEHFFASAFLEFDTPAGSNQVQLNLDGKGLRTVGRLRDASHVLLDMSVGYWMSWPHGQHVVKRWAPTMELHLDRGVGDSSVLTGNSFRLLDISDDRELLNLLVGATLDLDENRYLSFGYVTGIGGDGSGSDGELRVMVNWPFNAK